MMKNVKKLSAVALGMIAGFAIERYATGENIKKLKEKAKDIYEKISNKVESATEPKVEYVDEGEVVVDEELLTKAMDILCERSEDEDILFIGTIGFDKLSDAYYAMSVVSETLVDKNRYVSVYEMVYTLFEDEPDMFDYITKKYSPDILKKYGWVDPSAFEIRFDPESKKYIITDVAPVRLNTPVDIEEEKTEDANTDTSDADNGSAEDSSIV